MSNPATKIKPSTKGFSIAELSIALTIMVLLISMATPIYTEALEQAKLDSASRNLVTIWSAQRVYWLCHKTFAEDLDTLYAEDLISKQIKEAATTTGTSYSYSVNSSTDSSFSVTATRTNSTKWTGTITIDQQGTIAGTITDSSETTLLPITGS